jgi:hypothetical protein
VSVVKTKEKTLFLFDTFDSESFFFELFGNYSHLHGVYLNGDATESQTDELNDLLYVPETGEDKKGIVKLQQPTRDWTHFVKCGFIP